MDGHHDQCIREFEAVVFEPRSKKMEKTGEIRTCQCPKRGCKCYVKKADRTKPKTRRKK